MTENSQEAMNDGEVRDCSYVVGTPDADGDAPFYRVGYRAYVANKPNSEWPIVTRITLQRDVHGEFCLRARVCVWVGEKLVWEAPYQALTGVGYDHD